MEAKERKCFKKKGVIRMLHGWVREALKTSIGFSHSLVTLESGTSVVWLGHSEAKSDDRDLRRK